jgi:hypothetical protein
MIGAAAWEYAAVLAMAFALPLALLACAGFASGGVSPTLRSVALALLTAGTLVLVRQILRTGVHDLMPLFAVPTLVAAAVLYPLAAIALVRAASGRTGRLATARVAGALLAASALVQFAGPWMLTSGH